MIESVKIIHDWKYIEEYRFWTDLFRLIGAQVCDCTLRSTDFSDEFSLVIILENGIPKESLDQLNDFYARALHVKSSSIDFENISISMRNDSERDFWKKYLKKNIEYIKKNKLIRTMDMSTLNSEIDIMLKIGLIYVEYQISYHRNKYSYFYEDKKILQEAQNAFVNAYVEIFRLLKIFDTVSPIIWYTLADLSRYINETCKFLEQPLLQPIDKCLGFLDKALEVDSTFTNAYLLKGIITELDKEKYKKEGKSYFDMALSMMGRKKWASYPYYLQARFYEKVLGKIEEANELYNISLKINPLEYRALYKLAMESKRKEEYFEAIEFFKRICNILKEKEKENYLQPKEYEYLFKAYLELSRIYGYYDFDLGKYKEIVEKRNLFCDSVVDIAKPNKAYEEIFGNQALELREETYRRFETVVTKCNQ